MPLIVAELVVKQLLSQVSFEYIEVVHDQRFLFHRFVDSADNLLFDVVNHHVEAYILIFVVTCCVVQQLVPEILRFVNLAQLAGGETVVYAFETIDSEFFNPGFAE